VRCFVAIDLPPPVCRHLATVVRPLHGRFEVKWVPPDQMHATLVFAGELPDDAIDDVVELVQTIELPPLSLHLQTLGHFPPRGVPRVVWAGLHGDVEALTRLQQELEHELEPFGVPREKRGFTPHITLGRVRGNFGAYALTDELQRAATGLNQKPFTPAAFVLYESQLLPSGPIYTPLVERVITPLPD
jgi:2'-5' RNA ligase